MTLHASLYALHVLAAVIWVGGMFFAWMVLRPASIACLPAPERLALWVDVFRRFFVWVRIAVLVLPLTGLALWHTRFTGLAGAPRYVQVMAGLYLVMLALFLRIEWLQLPPLRAAVAAGDWQNGGAALGGIRRLVGTNLLLGLAVIALAAARPSFHG